VSVDSRDERIAAEIAAARGALERANSELTARPAGPERDLVAVATNLLRSRRKRAEHFPSDFFGEPAWDALLALYAAPKNEMRQIDVFSAARLPQATGLRWLRRLEEEGLIVTRPGPAFRSRVLVQLTTQGRDQLTRLLDEL
jgi:DNA-binding MarR family transcriptional regulator